MNLVDLFCDPPDEFGPVPFWWWVGEPLTRERLGWQLEQLRSKGVKCAIVSYNHTPQGETELGDPPLFSEAWWDLFRWVVAECKTHGMQIGFQDYTIVNPTLQDIGRSNLEMRGFGSLQETSCRVSGLIPAELRIQDGSTPISALAYPLSMDVLEHQSAIDLTSQITDGALYWLAPEGEWLVVLISIQPNSFDPTHPQSGALAIEKLYAIFEKECPDELGKTITILFQDELDFFNHNGAGFPIWSARIEAEFTRRKGYELHAWLPALWHDLGPMTAKVRIDYNDVCVSLLEDNYFQPIFDWCEQRGVLLGNDNCGRGRIAEGHRFYGDAFRTMRWFGAPGNDDAGPIRGHAFPGFKINSSIAHLYQRPRVWNEAFHSSGWGYSPAQIVAGFNEDCLYGATFFNLHGLYYTTYGSWWEWAAPDFHFRQPYWEHFDALVNYTKRISWLLSQGVHRCDVAILYPITTIEAGVGAEDAERHAFGLGRHLFDAGIDFDFVDFESLERATVEGAMLKVAGERYRLLIFPMMGAVGWSSLEKACQFVENGGCVIGFGCLPVASERAGSFDPDLMNLVAKIWSAENTIFVSDNYDEVREWIDQKIPRDFQASETNILGLHRSIDGKDVYFIFNRSDDAKETTITLRATGAIEKWDAWSGIPIQIHFQSQPSNHTLISINLEPREAQVIVFDSSKAALQAPEASPKTYRPILTLEGDWEFELMLTMDNRFGDFRLPPTQELLGPEARRFRYHEEDAETENASDGEFDDSAWPEVTFSHGPRFWSYSPLDKDVETSELETLFRRLKQSPGPGWIPYSFSLRWGIENDPFLKHPYSGPHGLKKRVPDEFIDLGDQPEGEIHYLWTSVYSEKTQKVALLIGSRSVFSAWLNHELVLTQAEALPPGEYAPWNLPHYESTPLRKMVTLQSGHNPLLLKFTIPQGQRMRAYVAFDPPTGEISPLSLRWFQNPDAIHFDYRPEHIQHAGWYRFDAPPGLHAMDIVAKGSLLVWVNGLEQSPIPRGNSCFRVDLSLPHSTKSQVTLRIEPPADSYAGDTLPEPIRFHCEPGRASLVDWKSLGLATYSGGVNYRRTFYLNETQAAIDSLILDLGQVSVCAGVRLNGVDIGNCLAPPWRLLISGAARAGENHLEILVMNTLANHYSVGIPTPYAWPEQAASGLIGPVRIVVLEV